MMVDNNYKTQDKNKFKNASGVYYLKALFFEECTTDPAAVLYTLKDQDHNGYPSLYRLYMQTNDPLEYIFADRYLGGFAHWEALCRCSWFKPYIARWRKELELKIKSSALASIIKTAAVADPKTALVANRFLLQDGWKSPAESKRGRPSKEEISKAAYDIVTEGEQVSDDYQRIFTQSKQSTVVN